MGVDVGIGVFVAVTVGRSVGNGVVVEEGTTVDVGDEAGIPAPHALIANEDTMNINQ